MPVRILFVCYENICRSPMAEGAFGHAASLHGSDACFEIESAGTVCYQSGSSPDHRAVRAAGRHGIDISAIRARCIDDLDLACFDRIFAMDAENYRDILDALDGLPVPVHMMTDFAHSDAGAEIEDPYYGSEAGFDRTMERLLHSATGIVSALRAAYNLPADAAEAGAIFQHTQRGDER
ncbi:low molecular weight phosphotyrosine protein phosphatase [Chlorobaculum sp. 24CR]|uniref:low molecular weight protein-tyrosine-phosphatase n=1 Tax=Chlorobaculum sp. 24CR TaxID=2508878 RepID=UPI00100B626B|nr:low molecular weight protein-tyrosine-phosphatase [Chlorobaculum sp. 24CR]RXK84552.1 low molecular weight phosphotyrosine protein phosphatase [Chlorobaculum sp. 24CR]